MQRRFLLAFLATVLIPTSIRAHNGSVAIAVPLEGIVLDGDLSDWPEDMPQYPIAPEYGDRPQNAQDLQGTFRLGYNEQEKVLYIAVEVEDESTIIDTD